MKKKLFSLLLSSTLLFSLTACRSGDGAASGNVVNVYNWGEYIDMSVLEDFEAATGIHVNYQTYDSNEALYGKLAGGATGYDVIIPSDYMIGQMIDEDMLEPLDFSAIPNFSDVDPALLNPEYDPENLYSIPYMFGILGIIYNPDLVEEGEDMETWDVLWSEKYVHDILVFDNSRDTVGIALKKLGYSYNTTDPDKLEEALRLLQQQKPLLQGYFMDKIFEKMEGDNCAIGVYYYGDYLTMAENNPVLEFAIPREGTNRYVDAMCVPKGCEHRENAMAFINFMCSTEAGLKNCEETYYSTPLLSVRDELDEELSSDPNAYPDSAFMEEKCETYACLPPATRLLYNDLWVRLINSPG